MNQSEKEEDALNLNAFSSFCFVCISVLLRTVNKDLNNRQVYNRNFRVNKKLWYNLRN